MNKEMMKTLINTIIGLILFMLTIVGFMFVMTTNVKAQEISDPEAIVLYVSDKCSNCAPLVEKVTALNKGVQVKQTTLLDTQKELKSLCEKEGVKENCGYVPLLVSIKQGKYYSVVGVDNIYDYIKDTNIKEYKISQSDKVVSNQYVLIGVGIFVLGLVLSSVILFKEYRKAK